MNYPIPGRFVRAFTLFWLCGLSCSIALAADEAPASWETALAARIEPEWSDDRYRAFDFWIGEWIMVWRGRQPEALHFDKDGNHMRHRVFPILGGKALIELAWDKNATADAPSQRGFSVRYFNTATERWVMAQNWPNAGNDGMAFIDQLVGFEDNGRLSMYSVARQPQPDGEFKFYKRRYNFADIRDGAFRWDGSSTFDEGAYWQTWNVVDAKRIRPLDPYEPAGTAFPGVIGETLCTNEPHGALDLTQGNWAGEATDAQGAQIPVTMSVGKVLDGCGVISILNHHQGRRVFAVTGYAPRFEKWISYVLDDQPDTNHSYLWAAGGAEQFVFQDAPTLDIVDEYTPIMSDDTFDPDASRRRTVWHRLEDTELAFTLQTRTDAQAPWTTAMTYSLKRK